VLPSAHSSPQPKRQIDRFSRFCTAHGRRSLYFTMGDPFPQKCPFSWGDLDPHLIRDSLSQTEPTVQRHLDRFSCFRTGDRRVSVYSTMGTPFPQNCRFPRGSVPPLGPSNTSSLAHPSSQTKRHLYRFSHFCADNRRVSLYFTIFPHQYCPSPWGDLDPQLIHGSLGPPESSTQMASRSIQPF